MNDILSKNIIGERIRASRQAKNLTRKELSALSGVSEVAIAQYETGKRTSPRKETIEKLAIALSTSASYLLDLNGAEEPSSADRHVDVPYISDLVLLYGRLNHDGKKIMEESLRNLRDTTQLLSTGFPKNKGE